MESNDSPEIPDRGETSDIPGLPSGYEEKRRVSYIAFNYRQQAVFLFCFVFCLFVCLFGGLHTWILNFYFKIYVYM